MIVLPKSDPPPQVGSKSAEQGIVGGQHKKSMRSIITITITKDKRNNDNGNKGF